MIKMESPKKRRDLVGWQIARMARLKYATDQRKVDRANQLYRHLFKKVFKKGDQ